MWTKAGQLARDLRIDGRLLLFFLLLALFAFFFFQIASEVAEGDTLALDQALLRALRDSADPSVPAGPAWLNALMLDITALGGFSVLTVLTIIVVGYLLVARKAATAAFLVAAVAGGTTIGVLLKMVFERARPDLVTHLVQVHTTSFPSGHATNSAVVFLTLGALLSQTREERVVRIYLMAVALVLTLMVGSSRVYLGVHWPSDVLAGWCVGAAWAALCSIVARFLQRHHRIEQAAGAPPAVL